MVQIINLSYEEKVKMYETIEKDTLIEMLIQANDIIDELTKKQEFYVINEILGCHHSFVNKDYNWKSCIYCGLIVPIIKQ